ncbi:MAG: polysaccharide biosynthesis/export family protein [Pseudomonadota bacterium]
MILGVMKRLFLVIGLAAVVALALTTNAIAQNAYKIRNGDILRVEVIEDPSLNRTVLVSPDGRISMPLTGAIRAAGKSIEDIQSELASGLTASFAARPNVFVAVERLAERRAVTVAPRTPEPDPTIDIFVMGEVAKPGKVTLEPGATVLQAFAQMGGFTRFAASSRVQLRRPAEDGSEAVYTLDYKAIEAGRSNAGSTVLAPGDVIVVPQRRLFE